MKYSTTLLAVALLTISGTFSFATAECQRPTQEEREATRNALFTEADADKNGLLTLEEYDVLKDLVEEARAERMFTCIDSNGDGAVSAEELAAQQSQRDGHGRRGGQGRQRPF
ncbi:MAG: hypothetical protein FJ147_17025 [Deltaproteobacteria bacterium]|nr:hypothetical protein [Deltaproteobacteria bacterium]